VSGGGGERPATFGAAKDDLAVHLESKKMDLESGVLGKFFGSGATAPTNIAGFLVLGSFLMLCGSMFMTTTPDLVDCRKVLGGLISAGMGFIFGAASKR
jgi:hypothetical protein